MHADSTIKVHKKVTTAGLKLHRHKENLYSVVLVFLPNSSKHRSTYFHHCKQVVSHSLIYNPIWMKIHKLNGNCICVECLQYHCVLSWPLEIYLCGLLCSSLGNLWWSELCPSFCVCLISYHIHSKWDRVISALVTGIKKISRVREAKGGRYELSPVKCAEIIFVSFWKHMMRFLLTPFTILQMKYLPNITM